MLIPIYLIWKVKAGPRRKLGLFAFLGLQFFIIAIAIIRAGGYRLNGNGPFDIPWVIFWQQGEACVSVAMLSLTAFRSYFVSSKARQSQPLHLRWYSSQLERLAKRAKASEEESTCLNSLETIPFAAHPGTQTFIKGGRTDSTAMADGSNDLEMASQIHRMTEIHQSMDRCRM